MTYPPGSLLLALAEHIEAVKPDPRFRGAALEAQTTHEQEWLLAGPAETGKTWAGLWRLDREMRATPGARGVLCRKVRGDMGTTVLEAWERILLIRGGVGDPMGGSQPSWYEYPNGSKVFIVGLDRPGKTLSGEFDAIYVNQAEELDLADWATLTTRVTGRGAKVLHPWLGGDCNPGPSTHWIPHRSTLRMLHSRHEDNPTLFDEQGRITAQGVRSLGVLDALPGVLKDRLRHGRWVSAEGIVYESFDRARHVIDPVPISSDWRLVASIDWGMRNPLVWQLWAVDGEGVAYLVHEIYRTEMLVSDLISELAGLRQTLNLHRLETTICDHDPEKVAQLTRAGYTTTSAIKDIETGIQAVERRLKEGRLRFFRDALKRRDEALAKAHKPVCTVDEFEVYAWPKDSSGRPRKEVPVKENDHGMDDMRYLTMYLDARGAPPERRAQAVRVGYRAPVFV